MDSRQFRIIASLLGVIGAGLLALVLVLVFSGDDEPDVAANPPPVTDPAPPPSDPGPAVTVPIPQPTLPAPTLPPQATQAPPNTPAPTTTTEPPPPPTTTEAPPPPTTTTEPPPPALVLDDYGIGGAVFGDDPDTTIAYAESVLGPADLDTGWVDSFSKYGTCPAPFVRGVEWQTGGGGIGFVLLFTQAETDHLPSGDPHFFGFYYFGTPSGLMTDAGITIGSTVGDALAGHPGSTIDEHPLVVGSGYWELDVESRDDGLLWGFTDGTSNAATLSSINGGVTCGE